MATYFIDASGGNDANAGTSSGAAWATIAKANAVGLSRGDTLSLKGGQTHSGNLLLNAIAESGTTRITITSYGTGHATINPSNSYGIKLTNTSYVTIDAVDVTGPGIGLSGAVPDRIGTTTSTQAGILIEATTDATWYQGVTITNATVTGCLFGIAFHSTSLTATQAYKTCTVSSCVASGCGASGFITYGTGAPGSVHVHGLGGGAGVNTLYEAVNFTSCKAENCYGVTSYDWGNGGAAIQNGFGFFLVNLKTSTLDRCYVTTVGEASIKTAGGGPTGFLTAVSNGVTLTHCEVDTVRAPESVDGQGFDADLESLNTTFQYCLARNCDGAGFLTYGAVGTTIRFSIAHNNGRRCDKGGLRSDGSAAVYHNTFYFDPVGGGATPTALMQLAGSGNVCLNNIFSIGSGATFGTVTGNILGNAYRARSGATFDFNGYASLAAMHTAGVEQTGGTDYGITSNPLFLNEGTALAQWPSTGTPSSLTAYDLRAGSPCGGAGYDVTGASITRGTTDFHGAALTDYTIGATNVAATTGQFATVFAGVVR